MKKINLIIILFINLLLFSSFINSTQNADKILGTWLTTDKDGHIEIYKSGNQYNGKLVWGKNIYESDGKTLKKDKHNEDLKLRNRTILNLVLLTGFKYSNGKWEDGKIYDPTSGKTYSCIMELGSDGKLKITGYIGFSFIGKTVYWTKIK